MVDIGLLFLYCKIIALNFDLNLYLNCKKKKKSHKSKPCMSQTGRVFKPSLII